MNIPEGQAIYFFIKDNPTDITPPVIFGFRPDPLACNNLNYKQVVDNDDDLYFQFDIDQTPSIDEIRTPTFASTAGWTLGAGWGIAGAKATITNAAAASSLTATALFDAARVGFAYKIQITVQSASLDGVVTFKNSTTEKQLTEGENVFFISALSGDFEVEASQGASVTLTLASAQWIPSTLILSVWQEDGTFEDTFEFNSWSPDAGASLTDNKVLMVFDPSGLADGCYYFSFIDPFFGITKGDSGLANGEFNVGNPVVDNMYLWTKALGAGVTAVGGDGLCTYASSAGNSGTLTNQAPSPVLPPPKS